MIVLIVFYVLFLVLMFASSWVVFTKAGEPGWAIFVPIYGAIVFCRICGKPWWWIFLLMLPFVNLVCIVLLYIDLAKAFGKDIGFAIGLLLLGFVFFPILAFGDAEYQGVGGNRRGRSRKTVSRFDDDDDYDVTPRRSRSARRDEDDDDDDDDRPRRRGKIRNDDDDDVPPRPKRRDDDGNPRR